MRVFVFGLGLAASALSAVFLARAASAEEVVLSSGARYEASEVVLLENAVRFTFHPGGGSATVTFPFERIEPHNLFGLLLARTPANDPAAQLRLARFALDRGLLADATYRFRRAAQMDALLAPERDAGLAAVARAEAERVLSEAENDLRRGRSDLALAKAKDVLKRVPPDSDLAAKANGLADLAGKVIDRDRARLEAEAKAKGAAAAAAAEEAFRAALARADKTILSAVERRQKAADPNLGGSSAVRTLESAETQFREGRRLLALARALAGVRADEVDARDKDALGLLVATHLDLADLYRRQRRFSKALDRVRAVLVLDPENSRALDLQARIDEDLRTPVYPPPDFYPYEPALIFDSGYGFGTPCPGYRWSPGFYRGSRWSGLSWSGSHWGFRFRW